MQQATMLYGPIIEVRDVLESFRHDQVLVANWRQRLAEASDRLAELGRTGDDHRLVALSDQVARLAHSDLRTNPLTNSVAAEISSLMGEIRVPGLPRPEDEDWSF